MAGMYGIADFASAFNRARDDSLESGFNAKKKMREDWLGDYRIPEQMAESDANAMDHAIKFDTLNQGYGDFVGVGTKQAAVKNKTLGADLDALSRGGAAALTNSKLYDAQKDALDSEVKLKRTEAERMFSERRAKQIAAGVTNEAEIAAGILKDLPENMVAANPYLYEMANGLRRKAAGGEPTPGSGLRGNAGNAMAPWAMPGLGYNFAPHWDEKGNFYLEDPKTGMQSGAFGLGGGLLTGGLFDNTSAAFAQYYNSQGKMAAATMPAQAVADTKKSNAQRRPAHFWVTQNNRHAQNIERSGQGSPPMEAQSPDATADMMLGSGGAPAAAASPGAAGPSGSAPGAPAPTAPPQALTPVQQYENASRQLTSLQAALTVAQERHRKVVEQIWIAKQKVDPYGGSFGSDVYGRAKQVLRDELDRSKSALDAAQKAYNTQMANAKNAAREMQVQAETNRLLGR